MRKHKDRLTTCEICGKWAWVAEVNFRLPMTAGTFGRRQNACAPCRNKRRGEWRYTGR